VGEKNSIAGNSYWEYSIFPPDNFYYLGFDMKFKNSQGFTYENYLHNTWYDAHAMEAAAIYPKLEQLKHLSNSAWGLMPFFSVIDYTSRKYVVSTESLKSLLGYDAREMLEGGLTFTLNIVQQDFFRVFSEKVFPATMTALQRIPQPEHKDHVFSFNVQYKNREGQYINTLQRSTYITSGDSGLPLFCMAMTVDIHTLKKDTSVVHTIEKIDAATRTLRPVEKNYFYPYEEDALLTNQEKNVLKYLADGLSSKMIAYRLGITENTIANHRKNMLRKTNTKNVAQLIAFSIRNGII
jgi:DNA-binding CsgD family transcriptional regulator